MSAALRERGKGGRVIELRAREQAAIKRLAGLLCTEIDPGKNQAQVLEELVGAADTLLGPAIGEAAKPVICQQCALHGGLFTHRTVTPDEIDEDPPQRLYAIDADDPDGGRSTAPVEALEGCHVLVVYDREEAKAVDAKYREENDSEGTDEQGPESAE